MLLPLRASPTPCLTCTATRGLAPTYETCTGPNSKKARLATRLSKPVESEVWGYRSFFTPSKRESHGLTIMPFTSLRKAAVSTTSENGWIDMTISSM